MFKLWKNREQQLEIYLKISRTNKTRRNVNAIIKLKERMKVFAKFKISKMTVNQLKEYRKSYYDNNKTKLKQKRRLYCNKIKLEEKYKKDHHPKSVKDGDVYKGYCIECGEFFISKFGWQIRCDKHKWNWRKGHK